jgi:hypothetical protein
VGLLAVASNLKVRTLLSLGYGCGLCASEVVRLKVKHIDSAQKIIRVEQSKRCYGASGDDKASSSLETTDGVPHAAAE